MPARHARPRQNRAATVAGLTALFGTGLAAFGPSAHAAAPTITIDPSGPVTLGDTTLIYAGVQISGDAVTAGDDVVVSAYEPTDGTCTNAVASTSFAWPQALPIVSPAFLPDLAGLYRWRVEFADNDGADDVTTPCTETVATTVHKATPTVSLTPGGPITLGAGTLGATVTVGGTTSPLVDPTGTVTFAAYRNDTCSGTPLMSGPLMYTGADTPLSPAFSLTAAGTYRWVVTYNGDNNFTAASNQCGAPDQTVVGKTAPTLETTAGADLANGKLTDTATVTGLINSSGGTLTFKAYGPADADCTGTPAFESAKPVPPGSSPAVVTSDGFSPTAPGTYRWVATYGGDGNNGSVTGDCTDPNETTIVSAVPTIPAPGPDPNPDPDPGYTCFGLPATMVGTNGNNTIHGTSGRDVIVARGGDDIIYGNGGDDVICAGNGDDSVDGGSGKDVIDGGDGRDTLLGGDGRDIVIGGADADDIHGNGDDDLLVGQGGNDHLSGGSGDDECRGGPGTDTFTGCEDTM